MKRCPFKLGLISHEKPSAPTIPADDYLSPLKRFAAISFTVLPMLWLYMIINHSHGLPPATVTMPGWVPFLPQLAPVYVAMLYSTWLLPLLIRKRSLFIRCIIANLTAYFLVMPWWIIYPTSLPRPPLPEGSWNLLYRIVITLDPPNNIMPCAHGMGPLIAAWFVCRERPQWRIPLSLFLLIGLPSIALVWQHRPVDILLGELAAVAGITFGEVYHARIRKMLLSRQQTTPTPT